MPPFEVNTERETNAMRTKKIFGTIGTAALAASLGMVASGTAQALKIDSLDSVTYAKETLLNTTTAKFTSEKIAYYNIARDHMIFAPVVITGNAGDDYVVIFDLEGMVFGQDVVQDDGVIPLEYTGETGTTFTIASGGLRGDKQVAFRTTTAVPASDPGEPTDGLTLIAKFAISENGVGSITRTNRNASLERLGIVSSKAHPLRGAVRVLPALKETVAPAATPIATAVSGFTMLKTQGVAMIGKLTVGVTTAADDTTHYRNAQWATGGAAAADSTVDALYEITQPDSPTVLNTAMLDGEVSFAKTVAFSVGACSGDIRETNEDDVTMFTDEIMPLNLDVREPPDENDAGGTTSAIMNLCITPDGETPIPAGDYTVQTAYAGLMNAAFPPSGGVDTIIGMIKRDGTTVHIPLLNLSEGYNHRIILRNRGSRAATYTFTFDPEEGTMAMPGMMAEGMVASGETKFLPARDVVTLTGRQRTAATLVAPVAKGSLDVSTSLTNLSTGGTDTETFLAAP
jgi:hypothetical protein